MSQVLYDCSIYAAKTSVVLLTLILMYRLLGKREIGTMNLYDLVTIVALSNAVQNAMTGGKGDFVIGVASSTALMAVGWFLSRLFLRAPKVQEWIVGSPTLIVYEGKVMTGRMKKEHVSMDELRAALHAHGLTKPEQAAMAVLEIDGSISIVPAGEDRHCTAVLT